MHELDHYYENESRYSCSRCEETGIDIESREYCTSCELGKRRMNLDRLAEPLRHHPFSNAMWIAHHSAMKTERAIAAADLALLKAKLMQTERELAGVRKDVWQPIETAPKDGSEIWAFNGEQGRMEWLENEEVALWIWCDDLLSDSDPMPDQPSHWRHLPTPPAASVTQANKEQDNG